MSRLDDEPLQEDPKMKQDERKVKDLPPLTDSDLGTILGFTGPELNANRMGRISPNQTEKLNANLKEEVDGMWLMLTILLGTSVLIALILFPTGERTLPLVVSIGAFIGVFMYYSYRRQGKARQLADTTRVKQAQGTPRLEMSWRRGAMGKIIVGDKTLSISSDQFMQLARYDLPYMKVYFTQNEGLVLSAEVLRRYNDDEHLSDENDEVDVVTIPDNFVETRR
jgi:hypothetical protein